MPGVTRALRTEKVFYVINSRFASLTQNIGATFEVNQKCANDWRILN